jgi:hypothetical protein
MHRAGGDRIAIPGFQMLVRLAVMMFLLVAQY